jgi:UDPglucose 6-dehydrogenase
VMAKPVLVDLRNVYRPEQASRAGFDYQSIGRGTPA